MYFDYNDIFFFFRCSTNSGRLAAWRSSSAGPEPYNIEVYGRRESGAEVPVAPAQTKPGLYNAILNYFLSNFHIYTASCYEKMDNTFWKFFQLRKKRL